MPLKFQRNEKQNKKRTKTNKQVWVESKQAGIRCKNIKTEATNLLRRVLSIVRVGRGQDLESPMYITAGKFLHKSLYLQVAKN